MLEKGTKISSEEEGCWGLRQAATYGHTSTVALLLDHGAKAIFLRHARTELPLAARSGMAATVWLLYECGFAHQGPQSLFKAVMIDPMDVVKLIIRQSVDIHARDTKGRSVLQFAVLGKRFDVSRWTVSYMSSLFIVQRWRFTTLSYFHFLWARGSKSWRDRCRTTTLDCLNTGRQSRSTFGGRHIYQSTQDIATVDQMIHNSSSYYTFVGSLRCLESVTPICESLQLRHN